MLEARGWCSFVTLKLIAVALCNRTNIIKLAPAIDRPALTHKVYEKKKITKQNNKKTKPKKARTEKNTSNNHTKMIECMR